MNPFAKLFNRTLPAPTPAPLRDIDGRFLPHRLAVRAKAIELARSNGRDDLVAKLSPHGRTTETPAMTSPEGHCPNSVLPGFE